MKHALLALILLCFLPAAPAVAQTHTMIETDSVRVCPAGDIETPPDFSASACRTKSFWDIDPQDRHIWVKARLDLGPEHLADTKPLGLTISGKSSSSAYINGTWIGSNGRPGPDRASEEPGRMDALLYVPRALLREGENTVVLRLSSMHGFLHLAGPMHVVALGPYGNSAQWIISTYWPSLITFGVFVLGFIFFGITALRGEDREGSGILSLASLFAGSQLAVEAGRALVSYAYPFHDTRLVLILGFAFGFGLCLIAYLLLRMSGLNRRERGLRLAGVAALMFSAVLVSPGFDAKTVNALLVATLAGMTWSARWAWQKKPGALAGLAILSGIGWLMIRKPGGFLDVYFYYAAAALLLYLFYRQALLLVRERHQRRAEEMRAGRLEIALAQARQKTAPSRIQLVSAGRTDYVPTDRIVQLKGAVDYVEVHFDDGATALYNGSLAGLEAALPETFIRVHRSHIVNTAFVSALQRDGPGMGRLLLSNGASAPVSRRIMPKVRSTLAIAAE